MQNNHINLDKRSPSFHLISRKVLQSVSKKIIEVSCAIKLVIIDSGVNFTNDQKRYQIMVVLKLIALPGVAVPDHLINQDL